MRKLFEEIKKNYVIAARNPLNYLIFILGPILFVLLIGLSFSGSGLDSDINILVVGEENLGVVSYLDELEDVNVISSPSVKNCKKKHLIGKFMVA